MAYSGINIQSQGQGGSGQATYLDVPFLRNAGIETLGVQIKPTQRKKKLNLNNWQQALQEELDWALEIVQACNDISLRQIKVVIRFNDLADDDPGSIPMNTEDWWDINNNAMNIALGYWQQVCQKFVGQEIFMFEILSEPVVIDASGKGHAPDRATLQGFYQSALNIVRFNFIDTYFLLSTGPYGTFYAYTLRNFQPYTITDPSPLPRLMYGFHMYVDHDYTHQGVKSNPRPYFYPSPAYNIIKLNQDFDSISSWSAQHGYPMYMGEFNAVRWSPNSIDWVRDVILNAKQFNFHWSFFAYKPNYDFWDPFYEVQDTSLPYADWDIHYVGKKSELWRFLVTQF
jgi:hypothetical protein